MSATALKLILSCLLIGGLIFSACQQAADTKQLPPIAKIYRSKCQTCHSLKQPDSRTDEEWTTTIAKHADRTKLTQIQLAELLEYLQRSN